MDQPSRIALLLGELQMRAQSGFAIALHVRFTTPTYLFQTYPEAWSDHYSAAGLVMQDPTVVWAFENTGVIRWRDLAAANSAGVLTDAARYGLSYGFALSQDRGGSRSLSSFSRGDREFADAEIADIVRLADALHDLTTGGDSIPAGTREDLRRMAVRFTHA